MGVLFSREESPPIITYPSYFNDYDESLFGAITIAFVDPVDLTPTEAEDYTMGFYGLLGGSIGYHFYDVSGGLIKEYIVYSPYTQIEPPSTFHKMSITLTGNSYFWLGNVSFKITFPPPDITDPGPSDECEAQAGAPINLTTGNVWLSATDYSVPGIAKGLSVTRTWNSLWKHSNPPFESGMFGKGWTSSFEEQLQVLNDSYAIHWQGTGNTWVFWKPSDCSFCSYSLKSPANRSASLSYDTSAAQYILTFKDGNKKIFSQSGLLSSVVDRNGNETTVTRDSQGRIEMVTAAGGQWVSYSYDDPLYSNLATSAYDSVGSVTLFDYVDNKLTQITYADSSQVNYQYDTDDNIVSVTDGEGAILETHSYDANGRGLSSSRANNVDSISILYPSATSTILTDSAANSTNYQFTKIANHNFLTDIQGPGCSTCGTDNDISFTLDDKGNRLSSTDANGNVTSFTYDSKGNTLTRTNDVGTWSYTYNSFSEVSSTQDPRGNITSYLYDSYGNLISITEPSPDGGAIPGPLTEFEYDDAGNMTKVINPLGNATTVNYTPPGYVESIKNALRDVTSFEYDDRGNRISMTDALGQVTSYDYDSMNRLTTVIYPDNSNTSYVYDHRGRQTSFTDANNITTAFQYDDADRLVTVIDASNNQTTYSYDNESNLISVADTLNRTTSYEYDDLNRVIKTIFPSNLFETYSYDNLGNLINKTDRNGQYIEYFYDSLNRVTEKSSSGYTASFAYDSLSRLVQADDPTGTYQFIFDELGRLSQTSTSYTFLPGQTYTVAYEYDAASNLVAMIDPENNLTTYDYDNINQLKSLIDSDGKKFQFTYDDLGRTTQISRPNSIVTSYTYDQLSRLLNIKHGVKKATLDGASYTLDAVGYRTSRTSLLTGETLNFSYDLLNQLTEVNQGAAVVESYAYDAAWNRLSSIGVNSYTYNLSNQLTATQNSVYTYDNNGNLTSESTAGNTKYFTWNPNNQLTGFSDTASGENVTFTYDPFGRRIYKSSSLDTTIFLYDGIEIIEELDANGGIKAYYTNSRRTDEPFVMRRGGATNYFLADGLGTITSLADSNGTITSSYSYDSFGNLVSSTGTTNNTHLFSGRELDSETGHYYYRARYYDPSTGRFISEDPIGFSGGSNFYTYVHNNPVNFIDPLGLFQMCHRNMLLPVPYARHCYSKFADGTTSSFDPNGVNPDPDPNQDGTVCTDPQDPEKDECIKRAMNNCQGSAYHFTSFNCCHCVEQAMKECGVSVPAGLWPNWPINPGPQPGEIGYTPMPVYSPTLGD
ncbi:RHS repeat-associated core domain-containing protein [Desulfosediminicola sp.]|uniref:RHS repeat-associated core domain-containing protein n=1 Tax=Desulfosediminicola sp. TaxID=2886825 RepID=UPI003AF22D34